MDNITILGAGFAALTAVKTLRKQGYRGDISLIAPNPSLFYYPSLIWVPAGLRDEASLTVPLQAFFERHRVQYQSASVTGLDPQARQVRTTQGTFSYETLLIASGGRFLKKLSGIEHSYTPCEGFAATKSYSDQLANLSKGTLAFGFASNPNEPAAMRGGPIFEFLFGIDTLLRQQDRRDQFELLFFSPAPRPGQRMGEKAVVSLLQEIERLGIRTHLGHKLKAFEANKIVTEGGEVPSDLTLFMPGMTGPAWAADSGLPLSPGGFFQVDAQCRVPGFEHIYVAGDAGSFPGPDWMPKQAHIADLQAVAAVKNILAVQRGQVANHSFKVELICIVDSLNSGIMVYRDLKRGWHFKNPLFHWAKRLFEWRYLRAYR